MVDAQSDIPDDNHLVRIIREPLWRSENLPSVSDVYARQRRRRVTARVNSSFIPTHVIRFFLSPEKEFRKRRKRVLYCVYKRALSGLDSENSSANVLRLYFANGEK